MYCSGNPVDLTDPTGHFEGLVGTMISIGVRAYMAYDYGSTVLDIVNFFRNPSFIAGASIAASIVPFGDAVKWAKTWRKFGRVAKTVSKSDDAARLARNAGVGEVFERFCSELGGFTRNRKHAWTKAVANKPGVVNKRCIPDAIKGPFSPDGHGVLEVAEFKFRDTVDFDDQMIGLCEYARNTEHGKLILYVRDDTRISQNLLDTYGPNGQDLLDIRVMPRSIADEIAAGFDDVKQWVGEYLEGTVDEMGWVIEDF